MSWVRIWVHMVFSTKNSVPFLHQKIRKQVMQHIKQNAETKGVWLDSVNGYTDHVHCLISLKEIKRSFGKKNLVIHADFDLGYLRNFTGVTKVKNTTEGIHLQITGEEIAENILNEIVGKGFVRKFVLEEPSLNDIFIEKAGASYE